MIPNEFINDLLNRVDIVDVVGQYVQLKRAGANHQGLCPFHNEKSPSFTVSASKQFYHCFGCGAHGTAVGFLMEHNGLTFVEAINDLARQAGMAVPQDKPQSPQQIQAQIAQKVRTQNLGQVLTEAATFYKQQLREHPHAIAYLKRRGLSGDIAQRFGLGFAPFEPTLSSVFDDYNESSSLLDAGLCKQREGQNRRYDFFRERIMFPIRNTKGQIIGFGGRVLDKSEPKYLNSPETPLFQKGQELYGLFEARSAISQQQYALIVEGYMDVVALAQAGLANAVATLGTATSTAHVQKLFRFTDTIVFSFDGDSAGRKAAWRAMINALPLATDTRTIKFLFLPPEHDPDTFVREKGADAFAAEVQTAMTLSQFLLFGLNQAAPDGSAEARARQLHLAKPLLQSLPNGALRTHIIQALAAQLNSTPTDVAEYCELSKPQHRRTLRYAKDKRPPIIPLVERALDFLIAFPSIAQQARIKIWEQLPNHYPLTSLLSFLQSNPSISPAAFHYHLEKSEYYEHYNRCIQSHLKETVPLEESHEQTALQAFLSEEKQIERKLLDDRIQALALKYEVDPSLKGEFKRLQAERAKLG